MLLKIIRFGQVFKSNENGVNKHIVDEFGNDQNPEQGNISSSIGIVKYDKDSDPDEDIAIFQCLDCFKFLTENNTTLI